MKRQIVLILLAFFCFQHIIRDYLQDKGIKNWYTTFMHENLTPDTPFYNHLGMIVFFSLGCLFLYLAVHHHET